MTMYIWFSFGAFALGVEAPLADPAQEARAQALFREIRCVVCQSEPIADSPAQVAGDMRRLVRGKVEHGESDAAIKAFLVQRYGDVVLMTPPLARATALLWFGPLLFLVAAMWFGYNYFCRPGEGRGPRQPTSSGPDVDPGLRRDDK